MEDDMTVRHTAGAVLLAAGLLIQSPSAIVVAQSATAQARFEWGALGVVRGQALRASVSSVAGSETVRVSAALLDAQGRVLAQSVPVSIAPGAFRSFDFQRDALSAPGDPTTGRLQVRLSVLIEVDTARDPAAMFKVTTGLAPTLELVDSLSGKTSESGMIGDIRTVISAEAAFQSANKDFY
jgi:hypothetical protein